jgi:hypothetical protein
VIMKIWYGLILSFFIAVSANAGVQVKDLPYLDGTPLEPTENEITPWTLLEYSEVDNKILWAWLEREGGIAYVVYPSQEPSVTFPDGKIITAYPDEVSLFFVVDKPLTFARFSRGGWVEIGGKNITVHYTIVERTNLEEGNTYYILGNGSLNIEGDYKVFIEGDVIAIDAGDFADTINLSALGNSQPVGNSSCNQAGGTLTSLNQTGATLTSLTPSLNNQLCGSSTFNSPGIINLSSSIPTLTIFPPDSGVIVPNAQTETIPEAENMQEKPAKKSKGGSVYWWFLVMILSLFMGRFTTSKCCRV